MKLLYMNSYFWHAAAVYEFVLEISSVWSVVILSTSNCPTKNRQNYGIDKINVAIVKRH